MAKRYLDDTGLGHLISSFKTLLDNKSNVNHSHSISGNTITGILPITKGGTGATTAAAALTNLGVTATAVELNYVDGVTSNIQTQLNSKATSGHTHDRVNGYKLVVSSTVPTVNDTTIITFVV